MIDPRRAAITAVIALVSLSSHAAVVETARLVVTGGPNAGSYDSSTEKGGCTYGFAGAGSWGNQLSSPKDKDPRHFNSLQLIVPDAKKAAAGAKEFFLMVGFGPILFVSGMAVFVGVSVVVQLAFWTGKTGQSQMLGPLLVAVVARESLQRPGAVSDRREGAGGGPAVLLARGGGCRQSGWPRSCRRARRSAQSGQTRPRQGRALPSCGVNAGRHRHCRRAVSRSQSRDLRRCYFRAASMFSRAAAAG